MSSKSDKTHKPDEVWFEILSRKPKIILSTFSGLSKSDQQAILDHLNIMITEDGWQKEQRYSAQIAINAISMQKGK